MPFPCLLLHLASWSLTVSVVTAAPSRQNTPGRPNIVLVVADDVGYNDVGYHGSEIQTSALDHLASAGLILENYYVQPICSPTRSQLMSGRYQIHTGLQHGSIRAAQPMGLPLDTLTLADHLNKVDYSTHMVGKWHLGFFKEEFLPYNRGFETFYGMYLSTDDHFNHTNNDNFDPPRRDYLDLHSEDGPVYDETNHYSTHLFTERAVDVINKHKTEQPLFLYLAYQAPHGPLQVPRLYEEKYENIIHDEKRRTYAAMVTALDEGIKNVTSALEESGLWNNTLFIFTSDNGAEVASGGNNYPLRGGKDELWEGGVRTVGIVAGGALNPSRSGQVNRGLIHVSDWFPTLVKLAGGAYLPDMVDGVDQWDMLNSDQPSNRHMLLHNIDPLCERIGRPLYPDLFDTSVQAAIRVGDYKLLTGNPGPGEPARLYSVSSSSESNFADGEVDEDQGDSKTVGNLSEVKNVWLYNIAHDPEEENDLSNEMPDLVMELLKVLDYFNQTAVPVIDPDGDPRSNPALYGDVWSPWM